MARAKAYGSGWHGQTLRHSRARKLGKAGGKYAMLPSRERNLRNKSLVWLSKETSYKSVPETFYFDDWANEDFEKYGKLSDTQLKKIFNLKDYEVARFKEEMREAKDSDGDGVPDHKDCQPLNKNAQDTYELDTRYDRRKSFYGKAKIETDNGNQKLYSYGTLVAEIKKGKPIIYGTYSATTLRHIKEFLKQNGHRADTSKQILKDYGSTTEEDTQKQNEAHEEDKLQFKTTAMVASLGEVFGKTKAEKNAWKKRMLKAGQPALDFPEDWDTLPESEKERRLDKAIAEMKK